MQLKQLEGAASSEEIPTELPFPVCCVILCLCTMTAGAWFLVVRQATRAGPSGLGASVGGNLGWLSLSVWHGMVCPLDEWGPPCEYGDDLNTVRGLEEISQSLRLVHKS